MDQNPQILIVEDNQTLLNNTRRALETAGYQPVYAHSGREALGLAAQRPFDLALVDLDLADVSGFEVCRQIKAAQPAFVVMLTGPLQGSEHSTGELEACADDFITRPIPDQELLAHLRAYLRLQQTQAALLACQASQASQAGLLNFVEQASEGILMLDEQGVIVEFNTALEQMTGLARQQALGQTAWDFQFQLALETQRTHAYYERLKARWLTAIRTGQSPLLERPIEGIYHRADGSLRVVSQSLFAIRTAAGFRIGGITRDVTGQKQAQEALRASEARFRQLYESMIDGYGSVDLEGRFLDFNQAFLNMLGYTAEELRQLTYFDVTPEKWSAFEAKIVKEQILPRGYSDIYEKEYRRKDGTVFPVELHTVLLRDESGKPTATWAIVRDISERKLSEMALAEAQALTKAIVDSTSDMIWSVDPERFGLLTFNPGLSDYFLQQHGMRIQAGMTPEELFPTGDFVKRWQDFYLRALKEGSYTAEYGVYAGTRTLQLTFNLLTREDQIFGISVFGKDITERKHTEQALRLERDRAQKILDAAEMILMTLDSQCQITLINQPSNRILGYAEGELVGKDWITTCLPVSVREQVRIVFRQILAGEIEAEYYENPVLTKAGEERTVAWHNTLLRDEQGKITGVLAAGMDITARKQSEQALRESEARLKEAEAMAHLGSFSWDAATNTRHWSDELYRIIGRDLTNPAPSQAEWAKYFTPESWAIYEPAFQRAVSAGEPYDLELEMIRPDGALRQVIMHGAAVTNAAGQVVRLHGALQDVTELRQAQENLRQTNQQLNALIQASPLGISALDTEGRVTLWSPACERLYGWTQAEVLGQEPPMGPEEMVEEVRQQIREELLGTQRSGEIYSRRRKDGTIVDISLSTAPLRDSRGNITGSMAIYEDISQRKQAEQALRESETKFRSIFENSRDAIDVTQAGRHAYVNPAFLQLFGYSGSDEVIGLSLFDLVVPEERPRVMQISGRRTLGQDTPGNYETRGLRKDGSQFDLEVKADTYELQGKRYTLAVMRDVSERKQAEEALRASEERYRRIFVDSPLGIATSGQDLRFLTANAAFCRMVDYSEAELTGMSFKDITHPAHASQDMESVLKLMQGDIPLYRTEKRYLRKDGQVVWGAATVTAIRNPQGQFLYNLAMIEDISERKRAEEALEYSERKYRNLVNEINDGLYIADRQGVLTFANVALTKVLGFEQPEEIVGRRFTDFIAPEMVPEIIQFFRTAMQTSISLGELEVESLRKDGTRAFLEIRPTNIITDGQVAGSRGVVRDITERKQAEETVRESEQRFRTFIEQSAEAVSLVDEEGRLIEWNDSMERLSGLKRQEVAGKFFWNVLNNLIPPEKRSQQAFERNKAALIQALQTGQSPMFNHTIEGEVARPDGERRLTRQTAFPIKTEKGFRLGSVSQDITELKHTEALRLAKEEAEAANRAKSEFLANMSHELRTPLNAMIGFSDMLSQQYYGPLTGKQVEYVQDIHESAAYLLALINDILDLSKIEAGRMDLETSRVDLKSLFEHSLVMVRERANKHALYMSSNLDPRLEGREFLADERKLRQVLYNLLANAVKFTPDGGAVDLSARLVDGVEGHQGQPWAEVSVTDTGIGLAADDLERIFEAFYQVKNPEAGKTPGTGLGLSLVKRMVELLGGQVWAESKGPGWGSRIVFTLPLPAPQPGEEA